MLGQVFRSERAKRKISQEALASQAGVTRNYLSLVELDKANITLDVFFRLCRALDLRPSTVIAAVEDEWPA